MSPSPLNIRRAMLIAPAVVLALLALASFHPSFPTTLRPAMSIQQTSAASTFASTSASNAFPNSISAEHLVDVNEQLQQCLVALKKPANPPLSDFEYWSILATIGVLVCFGGIIAGLTIGLMSLDETNLAILKRSGSATEKIWAERITPIRKHTHLLLVTLLLTNTVVNETLPVLFHTVHLDGYQAVLISTGLVVLFGEIIPQAVCTRYGLAIGAFFAWPVRILIWILFPIAYPIAKLLDWVLGLDHGVIYRVAELKELVALHGEDQSGPLTKDEVSIMRAVLDLRDKTVGQVMTELKDVFMIPLDSKLDRYTMMSLMQAGHSRVPIYVNSRHNIIGVVLVKQLLIYDPDDAVPLSEVKMRRLPRVNHDTPLFEMLHVFEQGGSHMAVVIKEVHDQSAPDSASTPPNIQITASPLWTAKFPRKKPLRYTVLGIVTLEDVIEELLGQEIIDETDVFVDIRTKVRVVRAITNLNRRTSSISRIEDLLPDEFIQSVNGDPIAEHEQLLKPPTAATSIKNYGSAATEAITVDPSKKQTSPYGSARTPMLSAPPSMLPSPHLIPVLSSPVGEVSPGLPIIASLDGPAVATPSVFFQRPRRKKTKDDVKGSQLVNELDAEVIVEYDESP